MHPMRRRWQLSILTDTGEDLVIEHIVSSKSLCLFETIQNMILEIENNYHFHEASASSRLVQFSSKTENSGKRL